MPQKIKEDELLEAAKLLADIPEETIVAALQECAEDCLEEEDKQIFLTAIDIFLGIAVYDEENDRVGYPLN